MQNTVFEQFQLIAFLGVTADSIKLLQTLQTATGGVLYSPKKLEIEQTNNLQKYSNSLSEQVTTIWNQYDALVFCLATGAVTRIIAPLLTDKHHDPAIIVIDAAGKFVISLCGGHQNNGDLLTKLIAQQLSATPIITGSSSSLNLPVIDLLGKPFGWGKGTGNWTNVMAAVAKNETVEVMQDAGSSLWMNSLPEKHSLVINNLKQDNHNTEKITETNITYQARIWISATTRNLANSDKLPKVQWHPRVLWIGIGCERNTAPQLIKDAVTNTLQQYHLSVKAIASIATIEIKADEPGIIQLCQENNLPLKTFNADTLKQITVPTPSKIVEQEVGTPSVAEAAAIFGGMSANSPDNTNNCQLLVKKQIFKQKNQGAVTIAIAQSDVEYTGRIGKLYLIGTGPGSLEQITPAAKTAITEADVVIGYTLYIDLIKSLLRSSQIIEALPITQEKARGERAIALAQWGLTVAVISSGDCGIYGMAGLILEQLKSKEWDGQNPQVQVFPGISALQATASRVGAPLMHDFCSISLSDLLTPWEVIIKRIEAAAMGDFVTVFYNPRSQKRIDQIVKAQAIFLQHRAKKTPVAIVKSVYREDEQITITTLEKMLDHPIDMLTTVIIGNSNTYEYHDWMITPRGYLK
ncbi:Precorrin-3B C17-methyltransferase [Hyella patelloides LEGE 07179]|uniref:Precorrin-3B C17-methyltransferase n=1 Tax=Hyella patelloides LEGE 07179 TaxID=945734 RepID=A0A563VUE5_9CYAN|nr:precorrin-3B C(17)-methyltransferase [Hyella patelloides]VEP15014.1 Precorrin-3B C17-methyltransferase [Hyella patelloides LEGE 07179]